MQQLCTEQNQRETQSPFLVTALVACQLQKNRFEGPLSSVHIIQRTSAYIPVTHVLDVIPPTIPQVL